MPTKPTSAATARRFAKSTPESDAGRPAGELIDQRIAELGDWRGDLLARLRAVIAGADPAIEEEWKWNTPVWSCHGLICTGETYSKAVKLTFAKGAALPDPTGMFNASLEGKVRRAIDFQRGAAVDEAALARLILSAIALNKATPGFR